MDTLPVSPDADARRARELYRGKLKAEAEREENIGKMLVLDLDSGDFVIDSNGVAAAQRLRRAHPHARVYGVRIGYDTIATLGSAVNPR